MRKPAGAAQTNGEGGKQEQHLQECRHVRAQQGAAVAPARTERFLGWSKIENLAPEEYHDLCIVKQKQMRFDRDNNSINYKKVLSYEKDKEETEKGNVDNIENQKRRA